MNLKIKPERISLGVKHIAWQQNIRRIMIALQVITKSKIAKEYNQMITKTKINYLPQDFWLRSSSKYTPNTPLLTASKSNGFRERGEERESVLSERELWVIFLIESGWTMRERSIFPTDSREKN
jgi:hypothetical protein